MTSGNITDDLDSYKKCRAIVMALRLHLASLPMTYTMVSKQAIEEIAYSSSPSVDALELAFEDK